MQKNCKKPLFRVGCIDIAESSFFRFWIPQTPVLGQISYLFGFRSSFSWAFFLRNSPVAVLSFFKNIQWVDLGHFCKYIQIFEKPPWEEIDEFDTQSRSGFQRRIHFWGKFWGRAFVEKGNRIRRIIFEKKKWPPSGFRSFTENIFPFSQRIWLKTAYFGSFSEVNFDTVGLGTPFRKGIFKLEIIIFAIVIFATWIKEQTGGL